MGAQYLIGVGAQLSVEKLQPFFYGFICMEHKSPQWKYDDGASLVFFIKIYFTILILPNFFIFCKGEICETYIDQNSIVG
jgi:hypothetical protein